MNQNIKTSVGVVIIIILAVTAGTFVWMAQKDNLNETPAQLVKVNPIKKQEEDKNQKKDEGSLFYFTKAYNPAFTVDIKKLDQGLLNSQILSHQELFNMDFTALGKYKSDQYMLRDKNKLLGFDPIKKEFFDILQATVGSEITGAALSHDGTLLAYGTYKDDNSDDVGIGEVWVSNLGSKESRKIMDVPRLEKYTKLFVEGWRADNKQLVVKEFYDGGAKIKGNVYLVDTNSINKFSKLELNNKKYFLKGHLSPNGERWVYHYCTNIDEFKADSGAWTSEDYSCKDGESVYVYSFADNKKEKIFTSKNDSWYLNKENLNIVSSVFWQDDSSVVAAIPDGVYNINTSSEEAVKLNNFDGVDPENIKNLKVNIVYANQDIVVFKRYDALPGIFVINLKNHKTVETGEDPQYSFMMDTREESY